MPNGTLRLEQALVLEQVSTGKTLIKLFGILTDKGTEVLQDRVEGLVAAGKGRSVWDALKAQLLPFSRVRFEPAPLC